VAIIVPGSGDPGTSGWADSVAAWINARVPVFNISSTSSSTTTTTEVKDTNVGDLTFTVADASAWYRVTYTARANADATSTIDIRIRDGGASSPTNASTQIGGGSIFIGAATTGATQVEAKSTLQFTVGTHIIAGFYVRTAGTGNVFVGTATGGQRILSVELIS
jgi:hypothetical protein